MTPAIKPCSASRDRCGASSGVQSPARAFCAANSKICSWTNAAYSSLESGVRIEMFPTAPCARVAPGSTGNVQGKDLPPRGGVRYLPSHPEGPGPPPNVLHHAVPAGPPRQLLVGAGNQPPLVDRG